MNRAGYCFVILLTLILGSQPCSAAKLKAYVSRFSVSTPENKEELKSALQTLLMSRLNSEEIQTIENQKDAEIQIAGSYIAFGAVFSLDALVKTSSGDFIDRVFVQGDTQNELIPLVTEMAKSLRRAILKWNPALAARSGGDSHEPAVAKVAAAVPKKETPAAPKKAASVVAPRKEARVETKPVNVPRVQQAPEKPWSSERFPEMFNGVARGRVLDADGTEIFITGEHYLRYYLKGKGLQLLSDILFEADEKVIGVDVADLDQNGVPEVYVTILKGGQPVSQVFVPEKGLLKKIKDNFPYMLRGLAVEGKEKKIFAQKMDAGGSFSGDVYEVAKNGDSFTVKSPLQLPLFGNLYNFNRFSDAKGRRFFIVAHPDGYLLVYSKDKKQLWKSRDKFGGSEVLLCQPENSDPASPSECRSSLPQRLLVTRAGEVVVSRNSGLSASGTTRSYSKNNVLLLSWDGTSLQEKLRTGQSQNYLADFSFDERTRELLLLELEPKADPNGERGSRVVTKKME